MTTSAGSRLASTCLFMTAANLLADVAIMRTGPESEFVFANAGRALDTEQKVPVTMRSAEVVIRLERVRDSSETDSPTATGGAKAAEWNRDMLQARCNAVFDLEHIEPKGKTVEFMVTFPVSGAAETIRQFEVKVDGQTPPLVRRSTVRLGYHLGRKFGPSDTPINGSLTGRFAPPLILLDPSSKPAAKPWPVVAGHDPKSGGYWEGIRLEAGVSYPQAFLWTQKIGPGQHQRVEVSYALRLHAQKIGEFPAMYGYPTETFTRLDKVRKHYLLDYILRSGATWEGPIGRETIQLSAEDGIELEALVSVGRPPTRKGKTWVWEIVNEKPQEDLLVALPQ